MRSPARSLALLPPAPLCMQPSLACIPPVPPVPPACAQKGEACGWGGCVNPGGGWWRSPAEEDWGWGGCPSCAPRHVRKEGVRGGAREPGGGVVITPAEGTGSATGTATRVGRPTQRGRGEQMEVSQKWWGPVHLLHPQSVWQSRVTPVVVTTGSVKWRRS